MSDNLPPLTALRAFEAAARHMSFANAAHELHVTPAALSFQIKSLEEHLGQPLFRRLNRAVELTQAGHALSPGTSDGFDKLNIAWRSTRRLLDNTTLTVTAGPAFTAKWLVPRMHAFAKSHPDIDLRIISGLHLVDLDRDEADVAIRFGYAPENELYVRTMGREWLTPMMRPDLADSFSTVQDLLNAPLIHNDSDDFLTPRCDWPAWFRAVKCDANPPISTRFSQPDHALDAALAGAGVILGRQTFAVRDLAQGRLVAPFNTAITTKARFRFLCRSGAETQPKIAAFRDWVLGEIEKTAYVKDDLSIIPVEDISK